MQFARQFGSLAALSLLLPATFCIAQQAITEIDPGIAQDIAAISVLDDHAHPALAPPLDKTQTRAAPVLAGQASACVIA